MYILRDMFITWFINGELSLDLTCKYVGTVTVCILYLDLWKYLLFYCDCPASLIIEHQS